MESALRQAITGAQLQLLYQPVVDMRSGELDALEALVRWQHPTRGLLLARDFIDLAEDAGLTGTIGDWVLQQACQDARVWREGGHGNVKIAINISPRQFRDRRLASRIGSVLKQFDIAPACFRLELTEAALHQDVKGAALSMEQLKGLGVGLALDDFGTGYSSLCLLKHSLFDQVKIDGAIVRDIGSDRDAAAVAKAIIAMAHHLNMRVVAEEVESAAQYDFLCQHHCDLIQGSVFAAPLSAADVGALLTSKGALPQRLSRTHAAAPAPLMGGREQNLVAALLSMLLRDRNASLDDAGQLLHDLALPVIGVDRAGLVAFVNPAAAALFLHGATLPGKQATTALPALFPECLPGAADAAHVAEIDGVAYTIMHYALDAGAGLDGHLVTLSRASGHLADRGHLFRL